MNAAVVSIEVVRFSHKSTTEQAGVLKAMADALGRHIAGLLVGATPEVSTMPTGAGVTLLFALGPESTRTPANVFNVISFLQRWADDRDRSRASPDAGGTALRIGVHVGEVVPVRGVYGQESFCGQTITRGDQVMRVAQARQVLLTDEAHRELAGGNKTISDPFAASFGPRAEVSVEPGELHPVVPMYVHGAESYWSAAPPDPRWWYSVSATPDGKPLEAFHRRLHGARSLALIQLTGRRLLPEITGDPAAWLAARPTLKRFWVFMPDAALYQRLGAEDVSGADENLSAYVNRWSDTLVNLSREATNLNRPLEINLGRFSQLGYYGSAIDWDIPGSGFIHVSPYIWGVEAIRSPGFDLTWPTGEPSPAYKAYSDGLQYLKQHSKNHLLPQASDRPL